MKRLIAMFVIVPVIAFANDPTPEQRAQAQQIAIDGATARISREVASMGDALTQQGQQIIQLQKQLDAANAELAKNKTPKE
jgi:hypothetical protein